MLNDSIAPLSSFSNNVYSQFGEDGIIGEILERLKQRYKSDGWCVEFGAWDGVYLSNTYNLIKNKEFKAVLIEGDNKKYNELCTNIPADNITKICAFVHFNGSSTLDSILQTTSIPIDFDFLSIDIDGCDYHILDSLKHFQPKIICIEYNPTIPNEVEFIQPKDFKVKQGASARSITQLASEKGYSLVAVTTCNLIFVKNNLKEYVVGDESISLESLRDDSEFKAYLFSGFDGTILTNKPHIMMPWHQIEIEARSLQQLPKFLRIFHSDYNLFQRFLFACYTAIRFPRSFKKSLKRKFAKA